MSDFCINEFLSPWSTVDDIVKIVASQNDKFLQELEEGRYCTKKVICENWKVKVYVDRRTIERQFKTRDKDERGNPSLKSIKCTTIECDFIKGIFGKCNVKNEKAIKSFVPLPLIEKYRDGDIMSDLIRIISVDNQTSYTFKNTRIKVVHD